MGKRRNFLDKEHEKTRKKREYPNLFHFSVYVYTLANSYNLDCFNFFATRKGVIRPELYTKEFYTQ
jgi:hypothetical protein